VKTAINQFFSCVTVDQKQDGSEQVILRPWLGWSNNWW